MVQLPFHVALLVALSCICTCASLAQQSTSSLEAKIDMSGIKGTFSFEPLVDAENTGGATVTINISSGLTKTFSILPSVGFEYHIHVKPVGQGGDCMATGGHLDPTNVGTAKCVPEKPEACQEGDLSGKHGNLKPTESGALPQITYQDNQLRFSGNSATIVGRSIVIHNNGTRVACGDIVQSSPIVEAAGGINSGRTLVQGESDTRVSSNQADNGATDGKYSSREILLTIVGIMASSAIWLF